MNGSDPKSVELATSEVLLAQKELEISEIDWFAVHKIADHVVKRGKVYVDSYDVNDILGNKVEALNHGWGPSRADGMQQ